jgi:hypothetical protein
MAHDNDTDSMNTLHDLVAKTSPKMRSALQQPQLTRYLVN